MGELIDFFGVPRQIMVVPEEDLVVLRYVRDSSYVTREAAGTYTGPQNGPCDFENSRLSKFETQHLKCIHRL
ncbi:hypothetical protein HU745_12635 [Pseudomonas mosselii]|uniref:hypothetical protein n=1 Tax=Pseudomonas mosselii TaxID=78327 RepID=UPI0016454158|nr:hypothetical protein [Pseudomonas mosselii]MBC3451901.1 hypothetical protein [Pseudomonas mosselii]